MKLVSTAPITTEDKETAKWRPLSARVPHSTHSVPRSVLPLGVAAAVIFNERPWITDSNVSTEINLSLPLLSSFSFFFPFQIEETGKIIRIQGRKFFLKDCYPPPMNVFEFLPIESIRGRRLSGLRLSRLPGFSLDVVNAL